MKQNSRKGFAMPAVIALVALLLVVGGVSYVMTREESKQEGDAIAKSEEKIIDQDKGVTEKEAGGAMMEEKSDEVAMEIKEEPPMMQKTGSYEAYAPEKVAKAVAGKVVLFFRASWCPSCRTLDADIRANLKSIPGNTTILDVNYDTATTLKQKHGVTYQHTPVQVDASGNQIAKWSGSPTLSDIVAKIK